MRQRCCWRKWSSRRRVSGEGARGHHTTFVAIRLVLGAEIEPIANYFERCRRKRNTLSYDAAGIATDQDAAELLGEVTALDETVEDWIAKNHPPFA